MRELWLGKNVQIFTRTTRCIDSLLESGSFLRITKLEQLAENSIHL